MAPTSWDILSRKGTLCTQISCLEVEKMIMNLDLPEASRWVKASPKLQLAGCFQFVVVRTYLSIILIRKEWQCTGNS